jgi:hypothetical protein
MSPVASVLTRMARPNTCKRHAGLLSRAGRINTPSQDTWLERSGEFPWGPRLLRVVWSNMLVMFGGVMLGDVIAQILHAGVPEYANITVADLVNDPEVPHFHGSGSLAFNSAVGNSDGSGIVTGDVPFLEGLGV